MEALKGKQSEYNHTRRRSDLLKADQRALEWRARVGDILLYPHSPLALAEVLSTTNGRLDLIANNADPNIAAKDSAASQQKIKPKLAALQQTQQRKHSRNRANLLTQHPQNELHKFCKRIQIENALVKRAGDRRLYLTAGFLRWTDHDNDKVIRRAPVLFYPVTLVRKSSDTDQTIESYSANSAAAPSDDENQVIEYELRIQSELPECNTVLSNWCHKHTEFELPEYSHTLPLQDYFAQLAEAISGSDNVELEFDVALGNAAPPSSELAHNVNQIRLPALPKHFDTSLAIAIAGNKNLQQLNSVLNLLKHYGNDNNSPSTELPKAANEATGAVSTLHEYSKKLSSAGLAGVEFRHLPALPDNISNWIINVSKAMRSDLINDVLNRPEISARHLIRLAGAIELIDKAPLNIEQIAHPDLCFTATPGLLQRARHQAGLIEDELSALQNTFVLDKVPAKKQLLNLIHELGGSLDEGPDIVDAEYFNARRQFMEFSIEKPTNLTPEHRSMLGKLAKVLRFRELFVNNIEYRQALGPGYRGLRTDWEALDGLVVYAQEISDVLESESIAATAMRNWIEFRATFINELEVLKIAAESLRKLLWVCGPEWQTHSVDEVIEITSEKRAKLIAWSEVYGVVADTNVKSPANVLAQFSGRSHEDIVTEMHVDETQATIEEHISDTGTSSDAVVETLEWLRQASETAGEMQLEITAIVDHLRIA